MHTLAIPALLALVVFIDGFLPRAGFGQDRVRIGVPLFPTVSYPVFIAHERGFFEKNGRKAEIIRINSEPTTYQALISGDIDATSGAPTGLVQSNVQGVPVVSLGSWDKENGVLEYWSVGTMGPENNTPSLQYSNPLLVP